MTWAQTLTPNFLMVLRSHDRQGRQRQTKCNCESCPPLSFRQRSGGSLYRLAIPGLKFTRYKFYSNAMSAVCRLQSVRPYRFGSTFVPRHKFRNMLSNFSLSSCLKTQNSKLNCNDEMEWIRSRIYQVDKRERESSLRVWRHTNAFIAAVSWPRGYHGSSLTDQ